MSNPALHAIYVYGTLRPNNSPVTLIQGDMYDLGWYPGVILPSSTDNSGKRALVACEKIEVDDARLKELDMYEGYNELDPEGSLYIRKPFRDGWIYEYNQKITDSHPKVVTSEYDMSGVSVADWVVWCADEAQRA